MTPRPAPLHIAVDVDDVCVDFLGQLIARFNRQHPHVRPLHRSDVTAWDLEECFGPEIAAQLYADMGAPDFYDTASMIPGSLVGVRTLRDAGHEVTFVSSCGTGESIPGKVRWLARNGFLLDYGAHVHADFIAAHAKHRIAADLIIDDRAENIGTRPGILFAREHNRTIQGRAMVRADTWADVVRHVEGYAFATQHRCTEPPIAVPARAVKGDAASLADLGTGGVKLDTGKPRMELLSGPAIAAVADVLTFGAAKYDDHNWRRGMRWCRPIGAAMRHVFAFLGGEMADPESGLPHLAHAMCDLMFALHYQITGTGTDDRYHAGCAPLPRAAA